jgi:hypothetical protein
LRRIETWIARRRAPHPDFALTAGSGTAALVVEAGALLAIGAAITAPAIFGAMPSSGRIDRGEGESLARGRSGFRFERARRRGAHGA